MSSKGTTFLETNLSSILENKDSLIVAALLFATGLILAGPSSYTVSSLKGFITVDNLLQQLIAGLLVVVSVVITFVRSKLHIAFTAVIVEKGTVAVATTLWTVGMLLVGVGNANGFTPVGIIASLIGYAILLVSVALAGTLGIAFSKKS